ncbi:MAG: ISKra4 family transposase [Deltaproteobacteria bacterium]|nr:ISKra4 family transposase [Deltaproteobacteria bacterium]
MRDAMPNLSAAKVLDHTQELLEKQLPGCGCHPEQRRDCGRLNTGQSHAIEEVTNNRDGGYPAMQIVLEIPEELKGVGEAIKTMVHQVEATWRSTQGGRAVEYAAIEQQLAAGAAAIERASHQVVLQGLDMDHPQVVIAGQVYSRVGRYEASYYTLAGPVPVTRTLYREQGARNAKTVNAVSLRCGVVGEGWLPRTAQAMAHQLQHGTSREAEQTAQILGRLPYARSSFESVGQEVGRQYTAVRTVLEEVLMEEYVVPAEVASVSVALDRVSVPMEEAVAAAERAAQPKGHKRKVWRQFRMAYCATLTRHDHTGEALQTLRYGRMPQGDVAELCETLAEDVRTLLRKRPGLRVILLADGAPELWKLLTGSLNAQTVGVPVRQLVDLWHLLEKLGSAARLLYGETHGSAVLHTWRLRLLNRSGSVAEILQELRNSGKAEVAVGTSRPVHEAITYLENHQARMNYAAARRHGLPVGSGNVEATCKSLVAVRMKRPGARWKEETGEHLLNLRALALSDRWEPAMTLTLRPLRKAIRLAA